MADLADAYDVLFLANHGVVVTGESVALAFDDLYYLERACLTQVLAESRGKPLKIIPENICQETHRQIMEDMNQSDLHLNAIKRILLNRSPDILD